MGGGASPGALLYLMNPKPRSYRIFAPKTQIATSSHTRSKDAVEPVMDVVVFYLLADVFQIIAVSSAMQ